MIRHLDVYKRYNDPGKSCGRFALWTEHREQITKLIDKLREEHIEEAIVLGAGACNDLDLHALLKVTDRLTLVDYDTDSMKSAIYTQELSGEEADRITLIGGIEFTGFYNSDFREISKNKLKVGRLRKLLEGKKYDLVITGAVHSQLVMPYVDMLHKRHFQEAMLPIQVANKFAEHYNHEILDLTKPGGHIICYYDILEISERHGTNCYEPILSHLVGYSEEMVEDVVHEIIACYGGVAGGRCGCKHFMKCLARKGKTFEATSWLWNFHEQRKYLVTAICVDN